MSSLPSPSTSATCGLLRSQQYAPAPESCSVTGVLLNAVPVDLKYLVTVRQPLWFCMSTRSAFLSPSTSASSGALPDHGLPVCSHSTGVPKAGPPRNAKVRQLVPDTFSCATTSDFPSPLTSPAMIRAVLSGQPFAP